MDEKKHHQEVVQLGLKLSNFRRKLAAAIGEKKINQDEFGEMYGGYSGRQINSYETGSSPVASVLLYILWENGHSLDGMFAENRITDAGKDSAARLYNEVTLRIARQFGDDEILMMGKELEDDEKKAVNDGPHDHTPKTPAGGKKASPHKTGTTKKRK